MEKVKLLFFSPLSFQSLILDRLASVFQTQIASNVLITIAQTKWQPKNIIIIIIMKMYVNKLPNNLMFLFHCAGVRFI